MNNGQLTPELAEKLLSMMSTIDDGNETIMTDSFTKFVNMFPEHQNIANRIYTREVGRGLKLYEERVSRKGY